MGKKILIIFVMVLMIATAIPVLGEPEENKDIGSSGIKFVDCVFRRCEFEIEYDGWLVDLPIGIPSWPIALLVFINVRHLSTQGATLKIKSGYKLSGEGPSIPFEGRVSYCDINMRWMAGVDTIVPFVSYGGNLKGTALYARFNAQ